MTGNPFAQPPPDRGAHAEAPAPPVAAGAAVWLIVAGAALALVISAIVLIARLLAPSPTGPVAAAPPPPAAPVMVTPPPEAPASPETQPAAQVSSPAPARRDDADAAPASAAAASVLSAFRGATDELPADPDAAWRRFDQALDALEPTWADLPASDAARCLDAVAGFVALAGRAPESAQRAADRVAAPLVRLLAGRGASAQDVWPPVLSAAALGRLAHDPLLPEPARMAVGARLALLDAALASPDAATRSGDARAAAGAFAALRALAVALAGADAGATEPAWRRWLAAVDAASRWPGSAADARAAVILHGAGALLRAASQRQPDPGSRSLVTTLLAQSDWTSAGAARRALLDWLVDDAVASRELAAVTQWLLTGAPGAAVGVDHLLAADADAVDRAQLRDRLASMWSIASPELVAGLESRWASLAREALAQAPGEREPTAARLARTAALARLMEAAARIDAREAAGARLILEDLRGPIDAARAPAASPSRTLGGDAPADDGRWALRFLAARRSAADRRAALNDLSVRSGALGPVDAEALMEAAMVGAPTDLRVAAQRIVERRADEPAIINAALEQLPRAPRNDAVGRLLARVAAAPLPSVRDKEWPVAARRALVARLLQTLAASAELAEIDRLSDRIADAFLGAVAAPSASSGAATPESPAGAAAALRADLRARAALALGPDAAPRLRALDAALDARRALARGPAQVFLAEQVGVAELLAELIAGERPSAAPQARDVLAALAPERAAAATVFAQIESTQRGVVRLWALRMGVDTEAAP